MTRRIIGIFLAVLLAVIGTSAIIFYLRNVRQTVAAGQQGVHVLVAKARIPVGTSGSRIRSAALVTDVVMPHSTLPSGYMTSIPVDLDKLVVTADVQANQLLLTSMFGQAGKFSGGLDIPDGLMAVTVPLREPADVAQYVRPGSQVAVFAYYSANDPAAKTTASTADNSFHGTEVILSNVTVLAVGSYGSNGQTATQAQDQAPLNGGTGVAGGTGGGISNTLRSTSTSINVTVAVNQADATRLIHMAESGELYLALLSNSSQVQPGQPITDKNAAIQ
jgi:pilus assembly protein CpaB